MKDKKNITGIITWFVALLTGMVVIILPLGFFVFSYQNTLGNLETEAEINADIVTHIISSNPEFWEFEYIRLTEYLTDRPKKGYGELRRIVNTKNEIVAESVDNLRPPLIMRSAELMDSGMIVGNIEIYRSLWPLLEQTGFLFLFVLPIGMGVFYMLRILPIRALQRAETALIKTNEDLETTNKRLQEEIVKSQKAEANLHKLNEALETRVLERTAHIETVNRNLKTQIAERVRTEKALIESEKKYRELVNFLPISLFEMDTDNNITSGNPALIETFGYTQDDLKKGVNAVQTIIPEQVDRLKTNILSVLKGEKTDESEYTGIRKDGSTFPLIAFSSPITRGGKIVGLSGAIIDLTERKRIEESLKKSNLSLAEAQRIAHIGNWEWNIESAEIYLSDEIYRIIGTTPQMVDRTYEALSEYIFPEDRKMVKKTVEKAMNEGEKNSIEHRIIRSDGTVRDIRQQLEPIIDDAGKIVRVIGIVQDVTEKNQVERDLQNARDQLLQSEKLASMGRLSAGVAHEILNPVNIISLELQTLKNMESLSPEVLEELNVCMAQISRIVTIAENLKQFSRIPEKKTIMSDINDVIAQVLTLYATQLKIEGIETEVQYQPDLPEISMDKEKIEQVIMNLITNASTAMEGKETKVLRITTEREKMINNKDQLKITIADTGTGIKSEHMSKIFDPFFTTKRRWKGTGLGLSISYGIINDHGGKIWAENNKWGGVSFYVTLPVKTNI